MAIDFTMDEVEFFDRTSKPVSTVATYTVQRGGNMSINQESHRRMGEPQAVKLGYIPAKHLIVIEPAEPGTPGVYPVRLQNKNSSTWGISATSFTKYHGINAEVARRYTPEFRGHTLVVDLHGPFITAPTPRRPRDADDGAATPPTTKANARGAR